jgi:hypothetical protein
MHGMNDTAQPDDPFDLVSFEVLDANDDVVI